MPQTHPALLDALADLDLAVVEWSADGTFQPFVPPPAWFRGMTQFSSLPFLEHVLPEAERFWHDRTGGALAFGPFALSWGDEELIVRVRALRLDGRPVLAIDRLTGEFDPRPMLSTARRHALQHEQLEQKAREVHKPVAALSAAVEGLGRTPLAPEQQSLIDAAAQAVARLREIAETLPQPFPRRRNPDR